MVKVRKGVPLQEHINNWQALKQPKKGRPEAAESKVYSTRDCLVEMLRTAIELEFATIPPYLCALWSIKDDLHPMAKSLREIVQEEMLHMGLACNMLAALGERPPINELAPKYPSKLPGGIHPDLDVQLQGLNKESLLAFLKIESPAELAKSVPREEGDPKWKNEQTIGEFYETILEAFEKYALENGTFQLNNQVSASLVWRVVGKIEDVKAAIGIITTQGEGAMTKNGPEVSPRDSGRHDYAHYYRFLEMWKEKRLVRLDVPRTRKERYAWRSGYELPECHPMGPVPTSGFPDIPAEIQQLLADFQRTYHEMLDLLNSTWKPGGQGQLVHAIAKMFELQRYAKPLMTIKRDDNPKWTYGPVFPPPLAAINE